MSSSCFVVDTNTNRVVRWFHIFRSNRDDNLVLSWFDHLLYALNNVEDRRCFTTRVLKNKSRY